MEICTANNFEGSLSSWVFSSKIFISLLLICLHFVITLASCLFCSEKNTLASCLSCSETNTLASYLSCSETHTLASCLSCSETHTLASCLSCSETHTLASSLSCIETHTLAWVPLQSSLRQIDPEVHELWSDIQTEITTLCMKNYREKMLKEEDVYFLPCALELNKNNYLHKSNVVII